MAKSRSAPSQESTGVDVQWTCLYPDCGATEDGFADMDEAAASASEHFAEVHGDMNAAPSFSYHNHNAVEDTSSDPVDIQELWDAIPKGNITKDNLAPFMKAAFGLK